MLQSAGGSLHASIQATSGAKDVFVTRVDANTVITVSAICTHAGCTLDAYDSSSQAYLCDCHGSEFKADGSVQAGPASTALKTYPSTITSTAIQVTVA
jgi:Rieske Fe-S protein